MLGLPPGLCGWAGRKIPTRSLKRTFIYHVEALFDTGFCVGVSCMIKDVIIHKNSKPWQVAMSQNLTTVGKKVEGALPALFAPDTKSSGI
jgi:hypothetical protein